MRLAILMLATCLAAGCNAAARGDPPPAGSASGAPAGSAAPQANIDVVLVVSKPLDTVAHLEGELTPYEAVALHARANGYVSRVLVDRGSKVKAGALLVTIAAPELGAQRAEAQAKLVGDQSTLDRLKAAAQTPGAVAGHEIELAQATVQADQARLDSLRALEQYLVVTAPFDGVITERNVHPGALVGPQAGASATPMLRIEQVQQLRLTVPVPEVFLGAIAEGAKATFSVRAFPGAGFTGTISRIARSVDVRTRSMAVELDVDNGDGRLAPGMFADVAWPVKRTAPSLFVPPGAVAQSTERTFVARVTDGLIQQVTVQRGAIQGDLVEIFGAVADGDTVARRATEDLKDGTHVQVRPPSPAASSSAK
jgi:RND family efflux transporter MFP subunit